MTDTLILIEVICNGDDVTWNLPQKQLKGKLMNNEREWVTVGQCLDSYENYMKQTELCRQGIKF